MKRESEFQGMEESSKNCSKKENEKTMEHLLWSYEGMLKNA